MLSRNENEGMNKPLRLRIRLDYRGESKPKGLFFGNKHPDQLAEETREHKAALLRNIPLQGIQIEDIDTSSETYTVFDEELGSRIAYAPILLTLQAEGIDDIIRLLMQEELRKVEILEPEHLVLNKHEIERILFKMSEEFRGYISYNERKNNQR